jgi:thiol-disulfide isomerase/thioredoxin
MTLPRILAVGLVLAIAGCGAGGGPAASVPSDLSDPSGVTVLTLEPAAGPLHGQLVSEAARLREAGRVPYLHVTATWCAPCKTLRALWDDPRLQASMRGAGVLRVDLDAFAEPLAALGVQRTVPAFYEVRADGSLGRTINGSAWGDDTVENIAPPLEAYFQRGAGADLASARSTVQGSLVRLVDGVPADAPAERVITVSPREGTSLP